MGTWRRDLVGGARQGDGRIGHVQLLTWEKLFALHVEAKLCNYYLGMTVWVRVLGHSWVLDPTSMGSDLFLHPRVEPALDP
jgi:hypothetical protein